MRIHPKAVGILALSVAVAIPVFGDVKRIAYIHGDVAANGTIPSGAAAAYDQMLLTDSGPNGLSVFRLMVEAEGYEIEQHYDAATTLDAAFLGSFNAIIFGLHQKIWSTSEKAALDTWLSAGGSFLTYSDSASGGFYRTVGIKNPVGQNAVNNLTTAYGLQVTVDQGGGTRAYTAGAGATHPIVAGPLVLEGEGVSPVAVDPLSGAQILIPFNTANRVSGSNLNIDSQGVTIANPQWASLALQTVGNGHVLVLFDRQPMWNSGPGSDITKWDNTEILRRTVRFMVGDPAVEIPEDSAPVITADPVSLTRYEDDSAIFTAAATGYPVPDLQWFRGSTPLGVTTPTLTLENLTLENAGDYTLVATNTVDTATSAVATLAVLPAWQRPPVPTEGLVAEWLFDENDGPIASDTSGQNRDGTLVAATRAEGQLDGGMAFNGTTSSIQIPAFDVTGQALTISLWMRHDGTLSRDARFISKAASTTAAENYWKIGPHDNRRLRARLRAGGTTFELNTANEVFEFATWHHIAMIYNGNVLRVLVDGCEVGSMPASGNLNTASAVGVALGDQPTGTGSRAFEGSLDQVRIYNRALNDEEISSLRQEPFYVSGSPFGTWMRRLPGPPPADQRGPLDDPDHDGFNNLLEFALGGDPMISGTAKMPTLTVSGPHGDNTAPLSIHYFKAAPDLPYIVEFSPDLAPLSWQPVTSPEVFDPGTSLHSRTHAPPAGSTRTFLRLKVRQPD